MTQPFKTTTNAKMTAHAIVNSIRTMRTYETAIAAQGACRLFTRRILLSIAGKRFNGPHCASLAQLAVDVETQVYCVTSEILSQREREG